MEQCRSSVQRWFTAIEKGQLSEVQRIWNDVGDTNVTGSLSLNYVEHCDITPLILSSYYGHKDIVRWFLNKTDADVEAKTNLGWRAIHFAAKRGHAATVDMLCNSGASVDVLTLDNESPLFLALQSNMRDTVCKLVSHGAKIDGYSDGLISQYVYRVMPPDVLSKSTKFNSSFLKNSQPLISENLMHNSNKQSDVNFADSNSNSSALINQLQSQSTSYDLELARRKRELIKKLPTLSCLHQYSSSFLQLIQRVSRADIAVERRLSAVKQLLELLQNINHQNGFRDVPKAEVIGSAGEPYLRLIEVCLCESHCPFELAIELTYLAIKLTVLGVSKQNDLTNGSCASDDCLSKSNTNSTYIFSYVVKLLKKLSFKSNPQYRSGILAHLTRIICHCSQNNNDDSYLTDLLSFAPAILSNLIKLGETLDQPINVSRFAQLLTHIGQQLIPSESIGDHNDISLKFADLADILVGWGVDPSSLSKGINLESIYDELQESLSFWFIVPDNVPNKFTLNENIREMVVHLLEDSENSLNSAIENIQIIATRRKDATGSSTKGFPDPNVDFISSQLYLKVLSSILNGICGQRTLNGSNFGDLILLSNTISHLIGRVIRIIKSTLSLRVMFQKQNTTYWFLRHTKSHSVRPLSVLTVLDDIEVSAMLIIYQILDFSDCCDADFMIVRDYVTSRVTNGSNYFSNHSLSAILHLIKRFFIKYTDTNNCSHMNIDVLLTCFTSPSILHHYKTVTNYSRSSQSPSEQLLTFLCSLKTIKNLRSFLAQLAITDLKICLSFVETEKIKSERLGLFSLALLSDVLKELPPEKRQEADDSLFVLIEKEYIPVWFHIPDRLRIALLCFISNKSFVSNMSFSFVAVLSSYVSTCKISPIECRVLLKLLEEYLFVHNDHIKRRSILIDHMIQLGEALLCDNSAHDLDELFSLCANLIMKYGFDKNFKMKPTSLSKLFNLCRISLSYPNYCVHRIGSDLALLIADFSMSNVWFSNRLYSELKWFTTRRIDYSATSLLSPFCFNTKSNKTLSPVTISAFPSLPAVAAILGIITRGSPYDSNAESSRLKIIKSPEDWIRRLSCLITPLSCDYKRQFKFLQCTSFIAPILWCAAWAMVDYKLKVAPWANPLNTFLALGGTLYAFIYPSLPAKNSGLTSTQTYYFASSRSINRQFYTKQLQQANLFLTFLGYLERVIHSAISDSLASVPRPLTPACNFFVANEQSCCQWFDGLRAPIIYMAAQLPQFKKNSVFIEQASSITIYHAYKLLLNVAHLSNSTDQEMWFNYLELHGGSNAIIINLSKALLHEGAWEELDALATWTDKLYDSTARNPFSWLFGVSALARGYIDEAYNRFNRFISDFTETYGKLTGKQKSTNNSQLVDAVLHVASLLVQMYLTEGNYKIAAKLCDNIMKLVQPMQGNAVQTQFQASFYSNVIRLNSMKDLTSWSTTKSASQSHEFPSWAHTSIETNINTSLMNILTNTLQSKKKNDIDINGGCCSNKLDSRLSELTSIVRQTSTAYNLPISLFDEDSRTVPVDRNLDDSLSLINLIVNNDPTHINNLLIKSSWLNLTSSHTDLCINQDLETCRSVCKMNNPVLAQRLLIRAATSLGLSENFDPLNLNSNIACMKNDSNFANNLHLLDCTANILWFSNNEKFKPLENKLSAISVLTSGLKINLVNKCLLEPQDRIVKCNLLTVLTKQLFDWLVEPTTSDRSETWAEKIHKEVAEAANEQDSKSSLASSIAHDLNLFTQLPDKSWTHGSLSVQGLDSAESMASSPLVWTNRLLMVTTQLSSQFSSTKAWLKMANWCYSHGINELNNILNAANKLLNTKGFSLDSANILLGLLKSDVRDRFDVVLRQYFNDSISSDDANMLISTIIALFIDYPYHVTAPCESSNLFTANIHYSVICFDDPINSKMEDYLYSYLIDHLPSHLSLHVDRTLIQTLHPLWTVIYEQHFSFFTMAAQAYATFLTLVNESSVRKSLTKLDKITATLKLLDLLCMPSRKLRQLISGFLDNGAPISPESFLEPSITDRKQTTPSYNLLNSNFVKNLKTGPTLGGSAIWESCLPQLIVRLQIPDTTIRNCLTLLLSRLIMQTNSTENMKFNSPLFRLVLRLIYPAVVATSNLPNQICDKFGVLPIKRTSKDHHHNNSSSSNNKLMTNPFNQIIKSLNNAGLGDLVNKVSLFTYELQRITLLWEELWIGSLLPHLEELTRKMSFLESEIQITLDLNNICVDSSHDSSATEKETLFMASEYNGGELNVATNNDEVLVDNNNNNNSNNTNNNNKNNNNNGDGNDNSSNNNDDNNNLINNSQNTQVKPRTNSNQYPLEYILELKYNAVLQATFDLLSQLYALTMEVSPQTPHEEWFQKTFGNAIDDLIYTLRHPLDYKNIKEPIYLIRHFINELQSTHYSGSSDFVSDSYLTIDRLSPKLSHMRFGCQNIDKYSCQLASCDIPLPGHFEVQSAKLVNRITVLRTKTRPKRLIFHGGNGSLYPYLLKGLEDLRLDDRIMQFFELTNLALAEQSSSCEMQVRTYSITPLGVRAGFIQMVQGAVPLFNLYKRWLNKSASNTNKYSSSALKRPGELFNIRFKEISNKADKRNASWKIESQVEAFNLLESETPADLLSRELWTSNTSCASWWKVMRTFAKSTGLLSSLGYLVGLGDRHLDNLLVDLSTGHIIHVDYNVCFDRGRNLRVAERVPFRLTKILRHALGPMAQNKAVRGTFRTSAEVGLELARRLSDVMLIQLKSFVIDPLIDWEQRKTSSSHSHSVVDFTHLSTFFGGGTNASDEHNTTSVLRRLRRINVQIRLYSGILIARLMEITDFGTMNSCLHALDSNISRLSAWVEWTDLHKQASLVQSKINMVENANDTDLEASIQRCANLNAIEKSFETLHDNLDNRIQSWSNELKFHLKLLRNTSLVEEFPNILMHCQSSDPVLSNVLCQYYANARTYLTSVNFQNDLQNLSNHVEQFLQRTHSYNSDIDKFIQHLTSYKYVPERLINIEVVNLLNESLKNTDLQLDETRVLLKKHESEWTDPSSAIIREIDNINLFFNDQGSFGIAAYCSALMTYVVSISRNLFSLESDPKDWLTVYDEMKADQSNILEQITLNLDSLVNIFDVLQHHPTGIYRFGAGYEANSTQEMTFLHLVHEATFSLFNLKSALIKLLIPEAIEALSSGVPPIVEKFSSFVNNLIMRNETYNLRQLVDDFLLKSDTELYPEDSRLHQIFVAVHLALTNTATQMEEIGIKIRSYGITSTSWYYVDIVSQTIAVLLSRASSIHTGATSLWGWESAYFNSEHNQADSRMSSWTDEIYVSGMTTFLLVLSSGAAHWSAIRNGSVDVLANLVTKSFVTNVDFFIGRLVSRLGLASLAGLAASRLFCALIEDSGIYIRHLAVENEVDTKSAISSQMITLSSEKLLENALLNYSATAMVQNLQAAASTLIQRLINCCEHNLQHSHHILELDILEKHRAHLMLSVTAYNWLFSANSFSNDLLSTEQNDESSYLGSFASTVAALKSHSIPYYDHDDGELDEEQNLLETVSPETIAHALWSYEMLHNNSIEYFDSYTECLNIAKEIKRTSTKKQNYLSELNGLDTTIMSIKNQMGDQLLLTSVNKVLLKHLEADLSNVNEILHKVNERLTSFRLEVIKKSLSNAEVDVTTSSTTNTATSATNLNASISNKIGKISANSETESVMTQVFVYIDRLEKYLFTELIQVIKFLSRFEVLRGDLINDLHGLIDSKFYFSWSIWLENYESWSSLIRSTKSALASFVEKLRSSKDVSDETHSASLLFDNFNTIKSHLIDRLLRPIFEAVLLNAESNTDYSNLLKKLLTFIQPKLSFENQVSILPSNLTSLDEYHSLRMATSHWTQKQQSKHPFKFTNYHALNVWRSISGKINGYDCNMGEKERMSTHTQLDACIREATDTCNLAFMYEGWTAWV